MSPLKRIGLFIICLLGIFFACNLVTGFCVGASAGYHARIEHRALAMDTVGEHARQTINYYAPLYAVVTLALSGFIAFGMTGGAIVTAIAGLLFLIMGGVAHFQKPVPAARDTPASSPTPQQIAVSTPPPTPASLAGRNMTLASPVTVNSPYGKMDFPAGTAVRVTSDEGSTVHVTTASGQATVVSRTSLK